MKKKNIKKKRDQNQTILNRVEIIYDKIINNGYQRRIKYIYVSILCYWLTPLYVYTYMIKNCFHTYYTYTVFQSSYLYNLST